ncbi:MAG: TraI domain-containing protein, partial [Pseudomonadota bacterium]
MAGQLGVSSPYASSDPGFPALPVDELLLQQAALLARIKLCHGSDREDFEATVVSLIRRYADLVHLLPATADNYFSKPGGLLHLGMEVGFFALQGTDAHIFSGRSTISARRHLEPRWRLATFIAGLCSEAHRVLTHVIVT